MIEKAEFSIQIPDEKPIWLMKFKTPIPASKIYPGKKVDKKVSERRD
jgi:hypothetical protein